MLKAKRLIGKLKSQFMPSHSTSAQPALDTSFSKSTLPVIKLPDFTGEYTQWPAFKEAFTSLILHDRRLTDSDRLHYLRGCLTGEPKQIISGLPSTGSSLLTALELLTARYSNKRLLIQTQLDRLYNTSAISHKNAALLNQLLSTWSETITLLQASASNDKLWEFFAVHQLMGKLDKTTHEQWETTMGSSQEFPEYSQLVEFLTARARAWERLSQTPAQSTTHPVSIKTAQKKTSSSHVTTQEIPHSSSAASYPCDCCNGAHFVVACPSFRHLTPSDRNKIVIQRRLCFNCLGRHNVRLCKSTQSCKEHGAVIIKNASSACSFEISHRSRHATLLATAIANVSAPLNNSSWTSHQARLLIDPGSELTFITEDLANLLHAKRTRFSLSVTGIGGHRSTHPRGIVTLKLQSTTSAAVVSIQAHILKTLTNLLPSFELPDQTWPHISKLTLADPEFLKSRPVDILIGADSYGRIILPDIIKGSQSTPIAQSSIFGWLILGPVPISAVSSQTAHLITHLKEESALQDLLIRFWKQEETQLTETEDLSQAERECEAHFKATHSRDTTGRYVVRIPLIKPASVLGDSLRTARSCLQRTLRRLTRDHTYSQLYRNFMAEYEQLGHKVRAPDNDQCEAIPFYLPHRGVLKPESTTTKLRVVFNGSAQTNTGYSVNDIMHTGPNLYLYISEVLIWIRHHRHLFATDVTKMYRQIKVHQDDWDLQRILWVDDELNEVPYQLTTVTYGTKAAPYLAVRTLIQLAQDEGHRFPLALPSISSGKYVDDLFGGADTVSELINVAHQLKDLCNAGGFPLAKWSSTHPDVLSTVASTSQPDSPISFDNCATKILGLIWSPHQDKFTFTTKLSKPPSVFSKRLVVSEVAQIFDPLGFLSPVVIRAKVLLQELWLHKLNWDDPLPSQVARRWLNIRDDLTSLARLSIPRWFNTWSNSTIELHGFSDASQLAMAAVIYIVVRSPSTGATTSLVCSKTKVAPLKSQPSRWKDFVRNRVAQIQELSESSQWRHLPGKSNPADCASRGLTTSQLQNHSLWWAGPPWMTHSQDLWPPQPSLSGEQSALEARPGISLIATSPQPDYQWDLIYRYSSLTKLLRVIATCFIAISRFKRKPRSSPTNLVSPMEREQARLFWVKVTQATFFSHELKALKAHTTLSSSHPFSRLTAHIDSTGVIRVGGRLDSADLSPEAKHPAILPRHSQLSSLIIADAHKKTLHGGAQLTLAYIRQFYWILGGRAPVKSHILRCVKCARLRGIRAQQLMGQLPLARVTPSPPFSHTGIDYAGPISLKPWKGRGAKTHKGWICVFVCFSTSAVHLEAVSDYSTDGFLSVFRRFTSRRGIPHTIYSDCGTNLIGADSTLKKMFNESSKEHQLIAAQLAQDHTRWQFNPPAAPHMGGKWEAVVKSTKFHLRRTMGETVLTYEEFTTLLSEIEAILNSRPLEPLSDDPEDLTVLTPGHFLIGRPLNALPEPSLDSIAISRLSRWQLIQQKVQQFWKHWSTHYLQRLQEISKWHHPTNNIKVNSVVLLTDERLPPCKWPLARVVAIHPGRDQHVRVVTVKTATTTLIRPLTKLAILPISPQDNSIKQDSSSSRTMAGGNV